LQEGILGLQAEEEVNTFSTAWAFLLSLSLPWLRIRFPLTWYQARQERYPRVRIFVQAPESPAFHHG
jgi:hypothetical protein